MASATTNLALVYSAADSSTKTAPVTPDSIDKVEIAEDDIAIIKSTQKQILNLVTEQNKTVTFNPRTNLGSSANLIYQNSIPIMSNDYILSTLLTNDGVRYFDKIGSNENKSETIQVGVPVYLILELGAATLGALCSISLVTWLDNSVPLINPIFSFMGLIASPFFYAMGRVSRREHQ